MKGKSTSILICTFTNAHPSPKHFYCEMKREREREEGRSSMINTAIKEDIRQMPIKETKSRRDRKTKKVKAMRIQICSFTNAHPSPKPFYYEMKRERKRQDLI